MNKNEELLIAVKALIDAGEAAGIRLRLLGGLAVRQACPSATFTAFSRDCSDADCIVAADPGRVQAFIQSQGWLPEAEFNLYNGDRRQLFLLPKGDKLDVFINIFSMCHDFNFMGRIPPSGYTVYPADLVLTKLQIYAINEKDLQDAACVFLDHEVCGAWSSGKSEAGIEADYIARLCSEDWGLEHSLVTNLEKTKAWANRAGLDTAKRTRILTGIDKLVDSIKGHNKSLAWRSRSILGTRLRWYRDVEEVDR